MTKKNNEDVPASVAGFYYQVLLACREITQLIIDGEPEDTKVGIERGADIKIIRSNDMNTSIEAKFYGASFTKYSEPIYHTISNFYKNSNNDNSLIFETNVAIKDDEDISFSRPWSDIEDEKVKIYIRYVKICLIREYIEKIKHSKSDDDKKIKEKYNKYREDNNLPKNDDFKLIEHILDQTKEQEYFNVNLFDDPQMEAFIRKFKFKFNDGDVTKLLSINEIKSQISDNLTIIKVRQKLNTTLDLSVLLIDKFLLTTVSSSYTDKLIYNIKDEFSTLSVTDVITLLKESETKELVLIESTQLKDLIKTIESQENEFYEELARAFLKKPNFDIETIKSNYIHLRAEMMKAIDTYGLQKLIGYYAIKDHGSNNTITSLLKYISIMVLDQKHDVNNVNFGSCPIANIRFDENIKYSYKYSSDDNLDSFIINLMKDIISKNQLELISNRLPILMNYTTKRSCEDESVELSVTPDIANIQRSNDIIALFSSLDYRCVGCFKVQQFIKPEGSFLRCKNINITTCANDK